MVGLKRRKSEKQPAAAASDLPEPNDRSRSSNDDEAEFLKFFDEEVSPPLHPVRAPFPFEQVHPRLRDWLAGKQYWLAIVLVSIFAIVVTIELFTNIDLGLVPNDPQLEGPPTP